SRFINRDQGNWRNRNSTKNEINGAYVPPRVGEPIANDSSSVRMEDGRCDEHDAAKA
ncbi:hypothetical protein HAX54_007483, partial [Datura stramonium]|nr:hypothetical protein [Datura stramonium]